MTGPTEVVITCAYYTLWILQWIVGYLVTRSARKLSEQEPPYRKLSLFVALSATVVGIALGMVVMFVVAVHEHYRYFITTDIGPLTAVEFTVFWQFASLLVTAGTVGMYFRRAKTATA